MYLPTFYKISHERLFFVARRYGGFALPVAGWGKINKFYTKGVWTMWPSIYNTIYTDFIPPARGKYNNNIYLIGVKRRIIE
jgi:hypothetical protein